MNKEFQRETALRIYAVLAVLYVLLGLGLLPCGFLGLTESSTEEKYFVGGFTGGSLALVSGLICIRVFWKGQDANNEVKRNEVGDVMVTQFCVSVLTVIGFAVGCIFAGFTTFGSDRMFAEGKHIYSIKEILASAIFSSCVFGIIVTFVSDVTYYKYGTLFGVKFNQRRMVVIGPTGTNMLALENMSRNRNFHQQGMQNLLLQHQFEFQSQLQQQLPPQLRTRYSSGFYPPPPPPPSQVQMTAYGVPPPPRYGVPLSPGYGVPPPPRYGVQPSQGYEVRSPPRYGVQPPPRYAVPPTPMYGMPSSPEYGVPTLPRYGVPPPPGYVVSQPPGQGLSPPPSYESLSLPSHRKSNTAHRPPRSRNENVRRYK